jgi:hypothetical protein
MSAPATASPKVNTPKVNTPTRWSAWNVTALSIPSAIVSFISTIAFVSLLYVTTDSAGSGGPTTALAVLVGALVANTAAACMGTTQKGALNAKVQLFVNWGQVVPATLYLALSTTALVLYSSFPEKAYADRMTPDGSSGQQGLGWSMLFASAVLLLNSFALKKSQSGLQYLMLPFLALAAVCLGVVWTHIAFLTTDG